MKVDSPDTFPTHVRCRYLGLPPPILKATDKCSQMISGDILPHEFTRFRELVSFVRAVVPSACVCELESANPDVWVYLAQISGGKSLFPHLQELHWAIREPSSTELLFIVSSSLRRLHVCHSLRSSDSREWKLSQSMLFRTIFNVAPHLTHLIISDTNEVLYHFNQFDWGCDP